MQDLRFPKHQFGLRLPKAIPVLGMTPARSRGHHATLDAVLGTCLIFFCKLDQGTDHLKLSPAHMLMYVAVHEAGQTWSGSRAGHSPVLKIAFLFLFQMESQQRNPFGLWLQDLGSGYVFCTLAFAWACFTIFGLILTWWTVCPRKTGAMLQEQPSDAGLGCTMIHPCSMQFCLFSILGPPCYRALLRYGFTSSCSWPRLTPRFSGTLWLSIFIAISADGPPKLNMSTLIGMVAWQPLARLATSLCPVCL